MADERRRPSPRRVSFRWLSGTFLTGFTGAVLVGGALQAPLSGLALPEAALAARPGDARVSRARLGDRPVLPRERTRERIVQVPVVTREGASRTVRKMPFGYAASPLTVAADADYPAFDSLSIFADPADARQATAHSIYDVDVETDLAVKLEPFSPDVAFHVAATSAASARNAVEAKLRLMRADEAVDGADGALAAAADAPAIDAPALAGTTLTALFAGAENVSVVDKARDPVFDPGATGEAVVRLSPEEGLGDALARFDGHDAFEALLADARRKGARGSEDESVLRIAYREDSANRTKRRVERISVYRDGTHVTSLARADDGGLVEADAPADLPTIASRIDPWGGAAKSGLDLRRPVARANGRLSLYDGLMRAALSQGLNADHASRLVRAFAFDVDYRASVSPGDALEVFYSMDEGETAPSAESRVLYAALTTSGVTRRYYAYAPQGSDGALEWYDETGKSAKKFLLRQPIAAGRFTSGFGMRRHPIARYRKMHTGVDWAAPSGTRIFAAGNGRIEKAGWAGGYGRQVKIAHANGYVTSYSHLRSYAKGIRPGARVRQGQFIGRVGTSGASTGPHLHYEVIVNGRKVNPMRIRLPKGRTLKGPTLAAFKRERDRIDDLIARASGKRLVASR